MYQLNGVWFNIWMHMYSTCIHDFLLLLMQDITLNSYCLESHQYDIITNGFWHKTIYSDDKLQYTYLVCQSNSTGKPTGSCLSISVVTTCTSVTPFARTVLSVTEISRWAETIAIIHQKMILFCCFDAQKSRLYIRSQLHRAAKQRILSNIKQTTSQNAYILYERLAGNQRNPLSKFFW